MLSYLKEALSAPLPLGWTDEAENDELGQPPLELFSVTDPTFFLWRTGMVTRVEPDFCIFDQDFVWSGKSSLAVGDTVRYKLPTSPSIKSFEVLEVATNNQDPEGKVVLGS